MIAVVGGALWRGSEPPGPAGRACGAAMAAAANGAAVELVGRIGDDPDGDALLAALSRACVGHVAVLRDPSGRTPVVRTPADLVSAFEGDGAAPGGPRSYLTLEPADVALGLEYLTGFSVLVLTGDVGPEIWPVAVSAAEFAGAHLLLVVQQGVSITAKLPAESTVLSAPDDDDDGAFVALLGSYAAALDAGVPAAEAWAAALTSCGAGS